VETSYAITSLTPEKGTAQQLLALWRGHWRILIFRATMYRAFSPMMLQ
jgi:hypothetical protein